MLFATQMLAPSKATPRGSVPTAKVPSTAPSLARSLVTVLLLSFVTQMLAPSKATPSGVRSHRKSPKHRAVAGPQLGHVVAAVVRHPDVGPVKGHASGTVPTPKVPSTVPSLARSLVTVLLP